MKIKKAKNINEYKQMQEQHIKAWIGANFVEGSVSWERVNATQIKVTDRFGDNMFVDLDDIP